MHSTSSSFIRRICDEALNSSAVNHPYLQAMSAGTLPDMTLAFRDFAFQYGLYSSKFVRYLSAVINQLENPVHQQILKGNLEEEQGDTHDVELPPDVLATVVGQPHSRLYHRFQEAVGVDASYRQSVAPCQTALLWSEQFSHLCHLNECVGIGAIGLGTELIVFNIYNQLLNGLKTHTNLTMTERVFFDLHSECDQEHAAQMISIAEDLAQSQAAQEQIAYGVRMATHMRTLFWDEMLGRAQRISVSNPTTERLSVV